MPETREVRVVAPPALRRRGTGGLAQTLVAATGSLGMLAFLAVGGRGALLWVAGGAAVLGLLGTLGARVSSSRRLGRGRTRVVARWRTHLAGAVAEVVTAGREQRRAALLAHPPPPALVLAALDGGGVWEGNGSWVVRLGVAPGAPLVRLVGERPGPLEEGDPTLLRELGAAEDAVSTVPGCPVLVDLTLAGSVGLVGPVELTRAVARSVLAGLLLSSPPGRLALAVDTADEAAWRWLRFLPHARGSGAGAPTGAGALLLSEGPPTTAGARPPPGGAVAPPPGTLRQLVLAVRADVLPACTAVLDVETGVLRRLGQPLVHLEPDRLSPEEAMELARGLAARRPAVQTALTGSRLLDLVGAPDAATLDVRARWRRPAGGPARLRAPLGVDGEGAPVVLDLAEAALGGHGPHGLVVGATGSGKSEALRSLVLGLALGAPPEELALVLVDWKGGAAFDDVAGLPHVAGLVTNLEGEPALVARIRAALAGELGRRQRVLRAAGCESVAAYADRRTAADLPAMPTLLIVIDEFGELLAADAEVLDLLLRVGRLGRSLGVHLLLSTQRLEEGRLRGLDAHLRYRLCLRTFTAAESTAVLGVPDAARLPSTPGAALLAVDGELTRLWVAHSGAEHVAAGQRAPVELLRLHPVPTPVSPGRRGREGRGLTERALAVRAVLAAEAAGVAPVWLPPLPEHAPAGAGSGAAGVLRVGVVDDPHAQAQPPLDIDIGQGSLAVAGRPGWGATSLLRALALAAAQAAPADALRIAVLAFGGGGGGSGGGLNGLGELVRLPHLLGLAGPEDPEHALLVLRSLVVSPPRGRTLLLIDGLARLVEEAEGADELLLRLAAQGRRDGVVLAVTVHRWAELRGLRDLVPQRFEAPLAEALDSIHPRGVVALLTGAPPGRLLTRDGRLAQVAVPPAPRGDAPAAPAPARLHPLPEVVEQVPVARPGSVVLGVRAGDLAPVGWEPSHELPHLVVLGGRGAGRTTVLRRVLAARPAGTVAVVDPRRGLREWCEGASTVWGGTTGPTAGGVEVALHLLAARAQERLAHPSTAHAPPARLLVVVDDAELLAPHTGPLTPLVELLRHGPDIGLAVVLARGLAGAGRGGYDPVLAALRDAGAATLVLPGDPLEGPVAGSVRPRLGPPGRATLVTARGESVRLQVACTPPPGGARRSNPPDTAGGTAGPPGVCGDDRSPAPLSELAAHRARRAGVG